MAGGLLALCAAGPSPGVLAQTAQPPPLSGVWRAGSTTYDVSIESWGEDCGPRPQSSRSAGGGVVNIEQNGGQLIIHGRGQDIRSDDCWSRNPAIRRQSTTFANSTWTTKCRTAPNDPREEHGTYTLRITGPDTLQYQDVSRYNWALNESRCAATFSTVQTLTRRGSRADTQAAAKPAAAPKPAVEPPPEPEEPDDDAPCTPGAPRRMVLRPRSAEIEVGQRVCFRPRVTDQAGCAIRNLDVNWKLEHSKALRGTLRDGCFLAAATAAEAEGEFTVVATLGALKAEARVSVHPVDLSALIAKRIGGGALTGFEDTAPLTAAPKSVTRVATRQEPASTTSPRKLIGIALGVAATCLALAALWLSRRKVSVDPGSSASVPSSIPPPPSPRATAPHLQPQAAPASGSGEAAPSARAPTAGAATRVGAAPPEPAPPAPPAAAPAPPPPPPSAAPVVAELPTREPWICPTCRVGYPASQQKCPKDGTALMPYAEFARTRRRTEEERTKRCPRCGAVFPSHASFCAEDGTRLVDA